jgi:cytosine/adenosine deaminase-related metal-dependent hydrolase
MSQENRFLSANYLFTNTGAALKNGILEVKADGEIVQVHPSLTKELPQEKIEYFEGYLVPGFVNAHCHLELSYAVARVERSCGIDAFIARVEELKREIPEMQKAEAIHMAMEILQEEGIVAVGDICNTSLSVDAKSNTAIMFKNFVEVYGLDAKLAKNKMEEAARLCEKLNNSNIVPHSTYSLSNELWEGVRNSSHSKAIFSIHNQESQAENQYFMEGKGAMMDRFQKWNLPIPPQIPTGKSPIQSMSAQLPSDSASQIFVHNTHSSEQDLNFIRDTFTNPWFCLCPSSNLFIDNELPNLSLFEAHSNRMCLGTDSLASNDTLSILHEMKILEKHYPEVDLQTLVMWSSFQGAQALGMENLGKFIPGSKPGIVLIEEVEKESLKLGEFSFVSVIMS